MKKILIAAILFLVSALPVFAQTNIDEAQGLKPYDSFHGGDLDSVSLTSGGLALHVPLLSYPQRGSLSLAFSLTYSSKQWTVITKCVNTNNGDQCTSKWEPLPRGGRLPLVTNPNQNYPVTGTFVASSTDWWLQSSADSSTPEWTRTFVSPDGNIHSFGGSFYVGLQYPMRSLDGSGLLQPDVNTLILPNGVRFSYVNSPIRPSGLWPTSVTDPNGNQILISASSWTDTMGRVIPASNNEPGIATTDLSACPAGTVSARVWDVPGYTPVSATRRFTLCYSSVSVFTNFGKPSVTEYGPTNNTLLSAVVLPDGTMWTLDYDNYGDITRIGFPTGGSISYTYGAGPFSCGSSIESASRWVATRTVDANDGTGPHTWQYHYAGQVNGSPWIYSGTATVTSPVEDGANDTVHTITSPVPGAYCSLFDTQVQYYQGSAASGTLLKTATTQYNSGNVDVFTGSFNTADNVVPTQTTVAFPGSPTRRVDIQYDSTNSFTEPDAMGVGMTIPVVFGSVLQKDEYDFYINPAIPTLVRSTVNHYLWQDNATYKDNNFLGLITSSTVKDGAGQQVAQTTSAYDQSALVPSGVSTSHVAPPAGEPYRGNLTTVSHWLNTTPTFLSSTATYYDTGMKATSTPPANPDGKNRTTTYLYDPVTFLGAYLTETDMPDTQMPDTGAAVVHHIIRGDYDFNTGLLTTFTDENGQQFTYTYDNMLRLAHANHPDGGQTIFTYPDPVTVDRQRLISGTIYDHYQVGFDGLGRPIQTRQSTPDCATSVKVDTTYDSVGRTSTVSNPYCLTTEPTYGTTTTQYDALSRATKTIKQDGSFSTVKYEDTPGDPSGAPLVCTTATDESGHQRQSCTDALGRLAKVIEPNPGAPATSASGSVIISGTEQSATTQPAIPASVTVTIGGSNSFNVETICTISCHTINIADAGTIEFTVVAAGVTVGPVSADYMGGSTPETLAAALYSNFPANSVVTMSDPNGTASFTLTTVATGSAANTSTISTQIASSCVETMDLSCSGPGWTMTLSGPNLAPTTASSANFTGGQDAATTDDSGNVTVTVNGTPYTTSYGTGDSADLVAGRLASLISAGSWADATASGGTINLTSKTPGTAGEYSLAASYTWNSAQFTNPSFTTSTSGSSLSGALEASALNNNPFVTTYQYDTLGNLLRVDQKGSAPSDSSQWRTRLFTYDSLSRLLTAHSPESGSMTYNYDPDGNLTSKLEPAPNQLWGGTAQVTITYSYDALNRLLDKAYSDGTTPQASYRYDYTSFMGQTFAYPIGRQVASFVAGGAPQYFTSYDPMGRVGQTVQCNPGVTGCKTFMADHNFLGGITKITYPANNFSVTYGYDDAARVVSATDSNGVIYGQNPVYLAAGAIKEFTSPNFANNKYHVDYNNRLQPTEIWTGASQGAGALFDKQYSYGAAGQNNGDIFTITNVKDSTRTQSFTYDPLNRLSSAGDGGHWANSYVYDAWANLLQKVPGSPAGENLVKTADTNNHLSGLTYDAAGNVINDGLGGSFVYDAENRITSTAGVTYTYDADGRRVQKSSGTNYWYGPAGAVLAETDASGAWTNYIFFGGQRLARNVPQAAPNPPDIKYYVTDHLHSTGIFADQSGTVLDDNDFYPWGGVIPGVGQTTSNNHYKFTGKERDTESQLDYFGERYYSNVTSRFMSPDPDSSLRRILAVPQRWNRYAYVINNPIVRVDTTGLSDILIHIERITETQHSTIGQITVSSTQNRRHVTTSSLEPPAHPDPAGNGATRMPSGAYRGVKINPSTQSRVGAIVEIEVPGHTGVRIHPGNTAKDSEGCVLPGTKSGRDSVSNSRKATSEINKYINGVIAADQKSNQHTNITVVITDIALANPTLMLSPDASGHADSPFSEIGTNGVPEIGTASGTYYFADGTVITVTLPEDDSDQNSGTDDAPVANDPSEVRQHIQPFR